MYCNQKYSGAVKGFLLGVLLVVSLSLVGSNWNKSQSPKNTVSFDEAVTRIKADDIKEVRIKNSTAEFYKDEQLVYSTDVVSGSMRQALLEQINSNRLSAGFAPESSSPFGYLIQILFWLFFISPPVIVVLLLIIIKKLDANSSNR
ncbi:MAG TPA: ATP-dependent metallopeptidase FtsH/Yme1/Tma family protein [Pyrinomonadaceae bacterium]|jgi:ATP-dependent Zn protease